MPRSMLPIGIVVLGFMLFGMSYYWTRSQGTSYWTDTDGPRPEWSEEDARELADAAASLHTLTRERSQLNDKSPKARDLDKQLAAAKQRYDSQRAKLDDSIISYQRQTLVVRWIGIGLTVIGFGGYFVTRRTREE